MQNDYGYENRQAVIHDTPEFRHQQKLRKAIERLGNRYVFHPDNFVKRLPVKLSSVEREQKFLAAVGRMS